MFSRAEVFRSMNQELDDRPDPAERDKPSKALAERVVEIRGHIDAASAFIAAGGPTNAKYARDYLRQAACSCVLGLQEYGPVPPGSVTLPTSLPEPKQPAIPSPPAEAPNEAQE